MSPHTALQNTSDHPSTQDSTLTDLPQHAHIIHQKARKLRRHAQILKSLVLVNRPDEYCLQVPIPAPERQWSYDTLGISISVSEGFGSQEIPGVDGRVVKALVHRTTKVPNVDSANSCPDVHQVFAGGAQIFDSRIGHLIQFVVSPDRGSSAATWATYPSSSLKAMPSSLIFNRVLTPTRSSPEYS